MTTTIWIIKSVLALLFVITGAMKLALPKNKLLEKGLKALLNINEQQIRGIGLLEVLGGIGLILPGMLNIFPFLSGIAAFGLALTMVVATRTHLKFKLPITGNIIILILCLLVAFNTFMS